MRAHSIVLHCPPAWIVPVNPAHDDARRDTERWLRELGVVANERADRILKAMNIGSYGGAPFPCAPYERLVTITRFLTLWIFHDDVLEGLGVDAPRVLGAAVRGDHAPYRDGSPYLRGWSELGRRFRATMSDRWLERFSARFLEWLGSVDDEVRLARDAHRSGRQPSFDVYMAVRGINVGVLPTACWIEYAAGRELDAEVLADPDLARAERLAGRAVALQNDLAGLDKDVAGDWPNAVLSVANGDAARLAEALDAVANLHDLDVQMLAGACDRLLRRHGDAARFWVTGLTRMVAGFAQWHLSTPRYTATLPGGEAVRITLAGRKARDARTARGAGQCTGEMLYR